MEKRNGQITTGYNTSFTSSNLKFKFGALCLLIIILTACKSEKEKQLVGSWRLYQVEDTETKEVKTIRSRYKFDDSGKLTITDKRGVEDIFSNRAIIAKWRIVDDTLQLKFEKSEWVKCDLELQDDNMNYQKTEDKWKYYLKREQ